MITRKEFDSGIGTAEEYYSQFVDDEMKLRILRHIGIQQLLSTFGRNFADMPSYSWLAVPFTPKRIFIETEETFSAGIRTEILKEASRQIVKKCLSDPNALMEAANI
jgi:hypothetical protein